MYLDGNLRGVQQFFCYFHIRGLWFAINVRMPDLTPEKITMWLCAPRLTTCRSKLSIMVNSVSSCSLHIGLRPQLRLHRPKVPQESEIKTDNTLGHSTLPASRHRD